MKRGSGKAKGSEFERIIAKDLSLWISEGRTKDLLWRTACSGGRASTGKSSVGFGDIGALGISIEGEQFILNVCAELKNYQEVSVDKAFHNEKADLTKWWNQVKGEAEKGGLTPMLIAKGSRQPIIIAFPVLLIKFLWMKEPLKHMILEPLGIVVYDYSEFIKAVEWKDLYHVISQSPFKHPKRKSK